MRHHYFMRKNYVHVLCIYFYMSSITPLRSSGEPWSVEDPINNIFNFFLQKWQQSISFLVDILWFILKVDICAGDDGSFHEDVSMLLPFKPSTVLDFYVSKSLNKGRNNLLHKIMNSDPCMGIKVIRTNGKTTSKLCGSLCSSLSSAVIYRLSD